STNAESEGGTYPAEAKGGNGLLNPVGAKTLQGSSNGIGLPPMAPGSITNVGEKGAVSAFALFEEFAPGAIKMPKAARIEVLGRASGCQAMEIRGEKLL